MTWRILDFSNFEGQLSYRRGHLRASRDHSESSLLPLADIAVILCGSNVLISSGLLQKLGTYGIPLLIVDWRQVPICGLQSWSNHTRVGARQLAQRNLSVPRSKHAWQQIIKAKITGQAQFQLGMGHDVPANLLLQMAKEVRSGDPTNVEGQAAKVHWKNFVRDVAFTRDANSADPLNAMLNYGYTILRGYAIRSVFSAGLWPGVGVFHCGRANAFNLADDLIEPFRPLVDHAIASLPPDSDLSSEEVKRSLATVPSEVFDVAGCTVSTVMTQLARNYGRFVEGDISRLEVLPWKGAK